MKTPHVTLPAAFLALATEAALVNSSSREVIASDGEALACIPLPEGFRETRAIPIPEDGKEIVITPDYGEPGGEDYDMTALRILAGKPAYRIAINADKLAALAAAIGAEEQIVVIEFPTDPEHAIRVLRNAPGGPDGFLMPHPCADGIEGLLVESDIHETRARDSKKPAAKEPKELPPPVVRAVEDRKSLEIEFGGRPAKEILEALKDLAFRYSGRGTRRGVPPSTWYGPDHAYNREQLTSLLGVSITEAKAA